MKREEEIFQTAKEVSEFIANTSPSTYNAALRGFYLGAKFADKTMLDRACEWLKNRHNIEKCLGVLTSKTEDLSKAFRQAMEGGAE